MDSKQDEIRQISSAINELFEKVEKLKSKLDSLCNETGGCEQIKKINREILKKKERSILNGTHINTLRKEE
jgi:acyl-[acyl carrier protein]--UDP-N-acetylglucosamine O-acyltransferase|tara:strand:+ start:246 stop:458 length:213 start_codon:yes stop_codon:yes gene_type:complete